MIDLKKEEMHEIIAKNVAVLLDSLCKDSLAVNLGAGMPLLTVNYLDNDNVYIHTENGMVGVGPLAYGDDVHPDLVNAGRQPVKETLGCVYTGTSESFGMMRGNHLDAAVLGAFEVDEDANISNWIIPGGTLLGVGGAMDLVCGAKTVIVAMTHTSNGKPKLVKNCTLPVTGFHEVDFAVTELGVFHFTEEGPILEKIHPAVTLEEVRQRTEFNFLVAEELTEMLI